MLVENLGEFRVHYDTCRLLWGYLTLDIAQYREVFHGICKQRMKKVVSLQIAMDEGISEGLRGFRSC